MTFHPELPHPRQATCIVRRRYRMTRKRVRSNKEAEAVVVIVEEAVAMVEDAVVVTFKLRTLFWSPFSLAPLRIPHKHISSRAPQLCRTILRFVIHQP